MNHPTSLASITLLVWRALEARGADCASLFQQAELDPAELHNPNARYPEAGLNKLWELMVEETHDPCFGITIGHHWHPTVLHALGFAWMASESLKAGLERLVRYSHLVSDIDVLELTPLGDNYRFSLNTPEQYKRPPDSAYDSFFSLIVEMCRSSYGSNFNPQRVRMMRAEPPCAGEFFRTLGAPIEFETSEDAFYFDAAKLEQTLPTANEEVAHANERVITEYLSYLDRTAVGMRVKAKLIDTLPSGYASNESIARSLNMSPRTLQRKLKEEGTTFKELLEETRREMAEQYIKQAKLSINEITFLLGFSEASNFSRAFKRWKGVSPGAYRETLEARIQ